MGSVIQTGYSLPGGNQPLTHARILHERNRFRIKTVTASAEVTGFEGSAANNGLTYDYWTPFANVVADPADFSTAEWTDTRVTIASDGQTITETATTGDHDLSQAYTWPSTSEHVLGVKVERRTVPEIQVRAAAGGSSYTCFFDLRDGTVGTASNATGKIVDLGNDQFECLIYFTPLATSGAVEVRLSNGSETVSYTGSTSNSIKLLRMAAHLSEATLRYDLFTAATGDTMAVAGHNLGTGGSELTFQHDSNEDNTWTTLETVNPTDNSPIMLTHAEISSPRWRVRVRRGVLPRISVFRVGAALQLERPLYGGHTPLVLGRQTILRSNYSETGEFLGRTKQRTYQATGFEWQNLTAAWVRANWSDLQRAVEAEPFFIAWRPLSFNEAGYCQVDEIPAPSNSGTRDLMSVGMTVRGLGYD